MAKTGVGAGARSVGHRAHGGPAEPQACPVNGRLSAHCMARSVYAPRTLVPVPWKKRSVDTRTEPILRSAYVKRSWLLQVSCSWWEPFSLRNEAFHHSPFRCSCECLSHGALRLDGLPNSGGPEVAAGRVIVGTVDGADAFQVGSDGSYGKTSDTPHTARSCRRCAAFATRVRRCSLTASNACALG